MKRLFTPGPLNTSAGVKAAMLADVGSRDKEFIDAVKEIRAGLLALAEVDPQQYTTVIVQGSGTFGIESVISSGIRKEDCLLVLANGAYGERMQRMAELHGLRHKVLRFEENVPVEPDAVEAFLQSNPEVTHVAMVHSETTTGLFNPLAAIGELCAAYRKSFIVDAMSSFGGVSIDMAGAQIDFLVSSSNKCIEGVPGFSFVICTRMALQRCEGNASGLSLDLYEQWKGLEKNGQFRFTPPTLAIMAFRQAMRELEAEGGISAREQRYKNNQRVLLEGARALGLVEYLPAGVQGHIINSFLYPEHPNFDFERFYQKLNARNCVIYPGKLSKANTFRIGNIGQLFEADMQHLIKAMAAIFEEEHIGVFA